ncbi:MAG: deoxynucleoside kinase [Candidatus Babeliales bacterium]
MNQNVFSKCMIIAFCLSSSIFANDIIVSLEGTTGAGKTTLLKILENNLPEVQIVYEPVEAMQDLGGCGNLLETYYKDMPRWSYLFQTYVFPIQAKAIEKAVLNSEKNIFVLDRSIYAGFYVFGKMLKESEYLNPMEWYSYCTVFDFMEQNFKHKINGFIYLQTSPETCYTRIAKRNRKEEQGAALDYYTDEFKYHEDWLLEKKDIYHERIKNDIPVLTLDGNIDFIKDEKNKQEIIRKIKCFINSIQLTNKNNK